MGTKVYLFVNDQYARYDRSADHLDDGYPQPIAGSWTGLSDAGFAGGIDAAVNWGNGKLFFFRGGQYVRYDIAADQAVMIGDRRHDIAAAIENGVTAYGAAWGYGSLDELRAAGAHAIFNTPKELQAALM